MFKRSVSPVKKTKPARQVTPPPALMPPAPPGWRFKTIGVTGLILGVLGGVAGIFSAKDPSNGVYLGVGLSSFLAPYIVVQRTKTNRAWQGWVGGIVGGRVAAAILLVFATGSYLPQWKVMISSGILDLILALPVAFFVAWMANITDSRREKMGLNKPKEADKPKVTIARGAATLPSHNRAKRKKRQR